MILFNNHRFACEKCISGHRASECDHIDRPLAEIKQKGRPVTQCNTCREKRRRNAHMHHKCVCGNMNFQFRSKLQVTFINGPSLTFWIPSQAVDLLDRRWTLEKQLKITIQRKLGKKMNEQEVFVQFLASEVIEKSLPNEDLSTLLSNPCLCQYGEACICCGGGSSNALNSPATSQSSIHHELPSLSKLPYVSKHVSTDSGTSCCSSRQATPPVNREKRKRIWD